MLKTGESSNSQNSEPRDTPNTANEVCNNSQSTEVAISQTLSGIDLSQDHNKWTDTNPPYPNYRPLDPQTLKPLYQRPNKTESIVENGLSSDTASISLTSRLEEEPTTTSTAESPQLISNSANCPPRLTESKSGQSLYQRPNKTELIAENGSSPDNVASIPSTPLVEEDAVTTLTAESSQLISEPSTPSLQLKSLQPKKLCVLESDGNQVPVPSAADDTFEEDSFEVISCFDDIQNGDDAFGELTRRKRTRKNRRPEVSLYSFILPV